MVWHVSPCRSTLAGTDRQGEEFWKEVRVYLPGLPQTEILPAHPSMGQGLRLPSALRSYEEEECFSLSPSCPGSGAGFLCGLGAVEACLLHQLRRRAAGFLRSDKMAALFTKVGKTCPVAGEICHKVQVLQQQVEGR